MMKRRKKKLSATSQHWNSEDWHSRCAWCHEEIDENSPVFGLSVRLQPERLAWWTAKRLIPSTCPRRNASCPS
jgi:hypothetical protein